MLDRRRIIGGMLVLTVGGTALMLPPLVLLFNHSVSVFGVPQIVLYLFALWLALIVGTALLTRQLPRDTTEIGGEGED
ncbi:MAG: hypothetical protein KIS86_11140 [Devosia sp.]|nr:hypothetical protein [Devosia sp.]